MKHEEIVLNNTEYSVKLDNYINTLCECKKMMFDVSGRLIGTTLMKDDFFFCASADRCVHLIEGLCDLLKTRNLTCAGALLRLQMDNCMRTYAAFIAEDKNKVIDCILSGNQLNKEKSEDGNKLNDGYLKKELNKLDKNFEVIYNQASGYIHLSSEHFYQTVLKCSDEKVCFKVGGELPEKMNVVLLEIAEAFIHFVKLHHHMLEVVADNKKLFEINCENSY